MELFEEEMQISWRFSVHSQYKDCGIKFLSQTLDVHFYGLTFIYLWISILKNLKTSDKYILTVVKKYLDKKNIFVFKI